MKVLRITALIVLLVATMTVGFGYLAGMMVEQTVLSPAFYSNLLQDAGLGRALNDGLRRTMADKLPADMAPAAVDVISGALARTLSVDWMEEQSVVLADGFLAFVKGERDELSAVIDLSDRRSRLREELVAALRELPPAQLNEHFDLTPATIESGADNLVADMSLPDQLELFSAVSKDELPVRVNAFVSIVQRYRGPFQYVPYLMLAVLLAACWLLAGWSRGLKWFGGAMIASGSITGLAIMGLWQLVVAPALAIARIAGEIGIATHGAMRIVGYTVERMVMVPAVYTVVGVVLVGTGLLLGRLRRPKIEAAGEKEDEVS